jgi:DNA excision repair protein ERCC-2
VDQQRLVDEYQQLVAGLGAGAGGGLPAANDMLANPALPADILNEAVPPAIRQAEHFVTLLDVIVKYLKTRIRVQGVEKETPTAFLRRLTAAVQVEEKPLRFTYSRLNSLLRTLQIVDLDEFTPISLVADFCTMLATPAYKNGFMIIIEPFNPQTPRFPDPILQLVCLDSSLAIKPVLERFQSVVITSGTLSPIDLYPKLLNFKPVVRRSLSMSIIRPCICPMVVTRGSDQMPISSSYTAREDKSVVRNYGALLVDLSRVVPDGMVCFFTSYSYMETVVAEWHEQGILDKVLKHKLVFIETKDIVETTLALDNYRRACDRGKGAVFLSVARGKVSEGIDFDRHYGRAVVLFGVPFQYTKSHVLLARLEYLRNMFQISEADFLSFDALRQAAQCLGRVIRSKTDYGLMILADKRYNQPSKRNKLPPWVSQFLLDSNMNLTCEEAVAVSQTFLRDIVQPIVASDGVVGNSALLTEKELEERSNNASATAADSTAAAGGRGASVEELSGANEEPWDAIKKPRLV